MQDPQKLLEGRIYLWRKRLPKRLGHIYGNWKILEAVDPPTIGGYPSYLIECTCGRFVRKYQHKTFSNLRQRIPCPQCVLEGSIGKIITDAWVVLGPAPKNIIRMDGDLSVLLRCIKCGHDQVNPLSPLFPPYPWVKLESVPVCSKCGGKGLRPRTPLKKRAAHFSGVI